MRIYKYREEVFELQQISKSIVRVTCQDEEIGYFRLKAQCDPPAPYTWTTQESEYRDGRGLTPDSVSFSYKSPQEALDSLCDELIACLHNTMPQNDNQQARRTLQDFLATISTI